MRHFLRRGYVSRWHIDLFIALDSGGANRVSVVGNTARPCRMRLVVGWPLEMGVWHMAFLGMMMHNLYHRIQLACIHSGITLSRLMLAVLVSAVLIILMAWPREGTTDGVRLFPPVVVKITQTDGWTCITRPDGQSLCLSEAAMQTVDEWRDETRYLSKGK